MRPECFKSYTQCVLQADYWAFAHDLDCAVGLASCVHGQFGVAANPGREAAVRQGLEQHQDALKGFGERIRALGPAAETDADLEAELDRFVNDLAAKQTPARG